MCILMSIIQFCSDETSGKNKCHGQNVLNLSPAVYILHSILKDTTHKSFCLACIEVSGVWDICQLASMGYGYLSFLSADM